MLGQAHLGAMIRSDMSIHIERARALRILRHPLPAQLPRPGRHVFLLAEQTDFFPQDFDFGYPVQPQYLAPFPRSAISQPLQRTNPRQRQKGYQQE